MSREREYSHNFRRDDRSSSRSKSHSRASTNRDRIRCFKCREYDHFPDNCPNSDTGESEQIQQLYNLDENQMALQILVSNTYGRYYQDMFRRGK